VLKRVRRSLSRDKRELEKTVAELTNKQDALRKKVKRLSEEKAAATKKAEVTAMDLDDTQEVLDDAKETLSATRKQLSNSKSYRKTVAAAKKQAESERDAALEEIKELTALANEHLEAYEELEMEMVVMMMTDDVVAKRNRLRRGGGGDGGGGGGGDGDGDGEHELKEVDFFHNGRYDDRLRVAVLACMRAGVGKDRIAELVAVILRVTAKLDPKKMPSPSTIANWAGELSNLTAIQLYDRLTTDPDATKVLAHDGTTMGGKKYGTARSVVMRASGKAGCDAYCASACLCLAAQHSHRPHASEEGRQRPAARVGGHARGRAA
jgi:hypothetical protein